MENVRRERPADCLGVKDECPLAVRLFGTFEARVRGESLPPLRTRKGALLLALLVLRAGQALPRNAAASILWPDSSGDLAIANLRRTLTDLRQALGPGAALLHAPTSDALWLDPDGVDADAVLFDRAIARGDTESLEEAVSLYRGPLLAPSIEQWIIPEREAREQAYLAALEALSDHAMARGHPEKAANHLRFAASVHPLRQSTQRRLMEALVADGDYAAAKRVYVDLRSRLDREMSSDPDAETSALFERIREVERRRSTSHRLAPAVGTAASMSCGGGLPGWLPRPVSSLVGRHAELREIGARLNTFRLLTLTGAGGVGKTRLAIRAAEERIPRCPAGVWFVELAPLADDALLPHVVASLLGVPEEPSHPVLETLVKNLRDRSLLLVLDNCEHLLDACARLADALLCGCRNVRILATSRQPLGVPGEATLRVPSLASADVDRPEAPVPEGETLVPALMELDAVRLFIERASAARPGWQADSSRIRTVAHVCRRLDGNALAIELAAARVRSLSVEQIAARLDDRFHLLTGGSRTALPRQQTLQGTLDWSYDLLTASEQTLLCRLSVFAGDWTLEAAEAVGENRQTLDLLTALVDKSMVGCEEYAGAVRYGLLETVRSYAAVKLRERAGEAAARERHGVHYLALAEEAERNATGPRQAEWLARLELENDNLRAALRAALQAFPFSGDEVTEASGVDSGASIDRGLRLCGSLGWFWATRGHFEEGRRWFREALERGPGRKRTAARAKALDGAGNLAFQQSDYTTARALHEESLEIWQAVDDLSGAASSLSSLGLLAWVQGDYVGAASLLDRSLASRREIGDRTGVADSLGRLGLVAFRQRDYAVAQAYHEESLAARRALGDLWGIAASLGDLGLVVAVQGDCQTAQVLCEESLTIRRALGDRSGIANALNKLGLVAGLQGDSRTAWTLHAEGLAIRQELGNRRAIAGSLEAIASLVCRQHPERAAKLWGAAGRVREETGSIAYLHDLAAQQRDDAAARKAVGEDRFAAAWAIGRAMSIEQAIGLALRPVDSEDEPAADADRSPSKTSHPAPLPE